MSERLRQFNPNTVRRFSNGEESPRLVVQHQGRTEVLHRHNAGFYDTPLRVVEIGAHPDDHALSEGIEHVLLNVNNRDTDDSNRKMSLTVVTATAGQQGLGSESHDISRVRIDEDVRGTDRLGAHLYHNLGFMDGELSWDSDSLIERMRQIMEMYDPHIIITTPPDDKVHDDHLAIQAAVVEALRLNRQESQNFKNPIVIYTDSQAGSELPHEGFGHSVGFRITGKEHEVFRAAYLDHTSQTIVMTPDIEEVLSRPTRRAAQLGVPGYAGIVRQDMRFSQEPISSHLGNRTIPLRGKVSVE